LGEIVFPEMLLLTDFYYLFLKAGFAKANFLYELLISGIEISYSLNTLPQLYQYPTWVLNWGFSLSDGDKEWLNFLLEKFRIFNFQMRIH
jgi:hypothetical protein